jgi:hypothetical protein
MDIEELSSFSMAIRGLYPRRAASQLFPGQTASSETVRMLKQYADNKVTAMMLRERGTIAEAMRYEKIADEIYDRLPEYAKW